MIDRETVISIEELCEMTQSNDKNSNIFQFVCFVGRQENFLYVVRLLALQKLKRMFGINYYQRKH